MTYRALAAIAAAMFLTACSAEAPAPEASAPPPPAPVVEQAAIDTSPDPTAVEPAGSISYYTGKFRGNTCAKIGVDENGNLVSYVFFENWDCSGSNGLTSDVSPKGRLADGQKAEAFGGRVTLQRVGVEADGTIRTRLTFDGQSWDQPWKPLS